jgi:Flp pilus assembly protein protease CpaA
MTVGYAVSLSESILRLVTLILIAIAGIQDLKTREVSNYISIPFFFAGLLANIIRFYHDLEWFQLVVWIQAAVILAGYYGWMGGADMKIFTGLIGLLPLEGFVAFIASGVVGGIVWAWTRDKKAQFPAVAVSAFAVAITIIVTASMTSFISA